MVVRDVKENGGVSCPPFPFTPHGTFRSTIEPLISRLTAFINATLTDVRMDSSETSIPLMD